MYPNVTDCIPEALTATQMVAWHDPAKIQSWVDLHAYEDDLTVLKNPHKGWYWHYIDNGFLRPAYRQAHDPTDHLLDFPGLNHLYLRYDWGDIEKEEGKPDWSELDRIMDEWSQYGYKFSMRICAFEGSKDIPFPTPEYVFRAGAKGYMTPNGLEPDYGDPVFLEKLEAFLEKAGRRFNSDPRMEYIDIGTFGTWGEGHTGFGTNYIYPAHVLRRHMDMHTKYFPDLPIIMNDDHINSGWARGEQDTLDLLRYARTLGLGLQDDSVCVDSYSRRNGYHTLRSDWMFDLLWEEAPIVLEFEHYHAVPPEHFKQGLPFLEAMKRTHCSYAGFHGYPRPWLQREPWFTEYCVNRLGYWYFLNGYELPMVKANARNLLRLQFENRGFGLAYRPYTLKVMLKSENGQFVQSFDAGNQRWRPNEAVKTVLPLQVGDMKSGSYGLYVGLFEGDCPIRLALKSQMLDQDMYHIGNVDVRE